ncbi:hypothetical protein Sjap_007920 [Stephania japonica]|uniref:Uncharacterized protein n=1 Tax=Stephania japonica TaxID=461633 RepID=A0AAP0JPF1_9MAGN
MEHMQKPIFHNNFESHVKRNLVLEEGNQSLESEFEEEQHTYKIPARARAREKRY